MTYRVQLTEGALADLDRLTTNLAQWSPEAADRLTRHFHEALPRLESFPIACGLAYESADFDEPIRHLLFDLRRGRTYRALFVVRGIDTALNHMYASWGLILFITLAALSFIGVFDLSGRPGQWIYLGIYVAVGAVTAIYMLRGGTGARSG